MSDEGVPPDSGEPVDEDDELVYELGDWSAEERQALGLRLKEAGVVFRWEVGSDLVVADADEDAVEACMDAVENVDALEPAEDDGDDEAVYAVISNLFVAADRLQHSPDDLVVAGEFYQAADAAADTDPPYGVAPELWTQVKELASGVCNAMETDSDADVIAREAASLRQLLSRFV